MKKWIIALAIWLIIYGAIGVFHLTFSGLEIIMGALAIIAGILMFVEK
jgi:hypothetical protein